MERVVRALSLYHVVEPKDEREVRKLEYLKASIGEGKDGKAKVAKINYERLIAEDKVIAILMATVEKDLASSIIGRTAAEAWKSLRPVHMINVMLHVWQQMQEMKVKDYECVVDYVAKMRDNMLILHAQGKGKQVFPEPMIVITALGQIQSQRLWIEWVADFYTEKMEHTFKKARLAWTTWKRKSKDEKRYLGLTTSNNTTSKTNVQCMSNKIRRQSTRRRLFVSIVTRKDTMHVIVEAKRIKLHNRIALMELEMSNKHNLIEKERKKREIRRKAKRKIRPC
jgi:hypothetical protein